MKNFLLTIVCVFCCLISFSQNNNQNYNPLATNKGKQVKSNPEKNFRVNVYGGLSITALRSKTESKTIKYKSMGNLNGGLSLDIRTGKNISLGIGLGMSTLSGYYTEKNTTIYLDNFSNIIGDIRLDHELNYIDIPLNMKYWFTGFNSSLFYLKPGLTLGILHKSVLEAKVDLPDGLNLATAEYGNYDIYRKAKLTADLGLGVDLPLSQTIHFFFEVNASLSLNNLYNKKENFLNAPDDFKIRGNTFNFNLGIAF